MFHDCRSMKQLCLGILCADIQRESNIISGSRNTVTAAYTSSWGFLRGRFYRGAYIRGGLFTGFFQHIWRSALYPGGGGGLYYFRLQVDGPITGGPYKRRGGRGKGVRLLSGTLRCLCCHQGWQDWSKLLYLFTRDWHFELNLDFTWLSFLKLEPLRFSFLKTKYT